MSGARGIRTRLSLLLGLALLPLTVMADAPALPAPKPQRIGQVQFEPCILQAPSGLEQRARALCGSLKVPENPQLPQGRQIELKLAWVPPLKSFLARTARQQEDRILLGHEGPMRRWRPALPRYGSAGAWCWWINAARGDRTGWIARRCRISARLGASAA